jgi:uncharacterized membrane protein
MNMGFSKFMASAVGRGLRAAVGVVLIIVSAVVGGGWWALAGIGLVLILVGVFDVRLLGPMLSQRLNSKRVRTS